MSAQHTEPWIPTDSFGSRLLRVRKQQGMTVEAIARACGIAHPTWTTWENGARPRDMVGAVEKIVAATGVDRNWLMWGAVDPQSGPPIQRQRVTADRTEGGSTRQYLPDSADFAAAA